DDVAVYFASSNSILSWDFDNDATRNPRWQGPVGMFGEAFAQSPNQNRIASCYSFTPANNISLFDDENLWGSMLPGRYVHPNNIINDTVALAGTDGDYIYGSDYFSLDTSETKRIVSVVAYGYAKGEIHQKEVLARALWNANFDTLLVQQEITITNFSSHRFLNGTVPINWTTQQSGGSIDIWFSSDAGRNWRPIVSGAANTGTFSWNTTTVEDCAFGLLRVFVRDANGNPYSFSQSHTHFTINNALNGSPFIRIMNEELTDTSVIEQQTYNLHLLIGDPESLQLTVSAYYRVSTSSPWTLYEAFAAPSDTNTQMHTVRLVDLPNSDRFQLKLQVSDGSTFSSDSTAVFKKRTPRSNVPPANFHVVSGFAEVPMAVRIVDPSRVRSDTYIITFDDTSSFTGKTFSVYNRTRGTYVLQNSPVQPGIESVSFDGLALYTEDVLTFEDRARSWWNRNPHSYFALVLDVEVGENTFRGYRQPNDYTIAFHDAIVDTSVAIDSLFLPAIPLTYQVFNNQTGQSVRVGAYEYVGYGRGMVFMENIAGRDRLTWNVEIRIPSPDSTTHEGDTLFIFMKKGLSIYDSLQVSDLPVSVGTDKSLPGEFKLYQNYPNPFNPTTIVRYQIPINSRVSLKVFDILGREVATLVSEAKQPGTHSVQWDASGVASGVYFYRLQAGDFVQTRKLLLLR
ncbi:MAG: hypothetical protein HW412_2410, partial [Bacteroidetes bacterium]|nr:hypothetical protein [Bacteroidota bacterium]